VDPTWSRRSPTPSGQPSPTEASAAAGGQLA
jgi:hypothetical protein